MRNFWMVIHGLKSDGTRVVYGGAVLPVYASGQRGVYLPNASAPITVPEETIFYVAPNTQIPFSLAIDVEGTVVADGGTLVQF